MTRGGKRVKLVDAIEDLARGVRKADLRESKREGNKPAFASNREIRNRRGTNMQNN